MRSVPSLKIDNGLTSGGALSGADALPRLCTGNLPAVGLVAHIEAATSAGGVSFSLGLHCLPVPAGVLSGRG